MFFKGESLMSAWSIFRASLVGAATLVIASVAVPGAGHAIPIDVYTLSQDGCSETCGTGPFGTVTVTQVGASLDIAVHLNSGNIFHDSKDPQHHALVFDLAGNPTITISGLPSPFTANGSQLAGSHSAAPFGTFDYVVNFPFQIHPPSLTDFSFLMSAIGGLTLSDIVSNKGIFFATDITGNNGNTGNVGAVAVPGPIAGAGLPGLAAAWGGLLMPTRRRRNKGA